MGTIDDLNAFDAKILIVDDVETNRILLGSILSVYRHFHLLFAANGEEALKILETQTPDLILLDIMMPKMDGFKLADAVKANALTKDIPLIFITALDSIEDKTKAFEKGGIDYIVKPFHSQEVLSRINAHLRVKKQYEQIRSFGKSVGEQLAVARKIQENFIHPGTVRFPHFQTYTEYLPLEDVSGDIYAVIPMNASAYLICIADIMGHGLPAALYSMMLKTTLEKVIQQKSESMRADMILSRLNRELCEVLLSDYFITAFLCILDFETMTLDYSNAAHIPPIFYSPKEGAFRNLDEHDIALGINSVWKYQGVQIPIHSGDRLFLFTDGITENKNKNNKQMGREYVAELYRSTLNEPIDKQTEMILNRVFTELRDQKFMDDVTLLNIELY